MATPPQFVSYGETVWNSVATPKSVSVTTQTGDRIVVLIAVENGNQATTTPSAPSGNGNTFTKQAQYPTTSLNADGMTVIWTATEVAGATYSLSIPRPTGASSMWGAGVSVWRASDGFGAVAQLTADASNSIAITTQADNSAICAVHSDWNAVDGTTRTRRTINGSTGTERTYFRDSATYTVYVQDYADAGAAGSKTAGYSAPTGQAAISAAIEIKGTAGAAPPAQLPSWTNRQALRVSAYW